MTNKTYISKDGFNALEVFTEQLCETNHLYNYIGAINTVAQCLLQFVNDNITIEDSRYKDGICLIISANNPVFTVMNNNNSAEQNLDVVFLVKSLTDKYSVSNEGKTIELFFQVNGIEEELTIDRQQKIRTYSHSKTTILN